MVDKGAVCMTSDHLWLTNDAKRSYQDTEGYDNSHGMCQCHVPRCAVPVAQYQKKLA